MVAKIGEAIWKDLRAWKRRQQFQRDIESLRIDIRIADRQKENEKVMRLLVYRQELVAEARGLRGGLDGRQV